MKNELYIVYKPLLKVRDLSIEPRFSTMCIDLSIHVHEEANVDRHVLRDWKETVYKFIDEKVASLKQRKINKRKKHVLKSRVNLDNLNKLHDNFVLVYTC